MGSLISLLEYLKKYPLFNSVTVQNKLGKSRAYTNLFLYRLCRRGIIFRIERNKYTVLRDPFLIASRIIWPSYISCWSALKYHNLTEQVLHDISVILTVDKRPVLFNIAKIIFFKIQPKFFFGYEKVKYEGFEVFIANIEKSIIDSALLRKVSFSELIEIMSANIRLIKIGRFLKYLKRIGNKSLIKRFGYAFDLLGKDYYPVFKKYINQTYIPLDYSKEKEGKKSLKWRVIINA